MWLRIPKASVVLFENKGGEGEDIAASFFSSFSFFLNAALVECENGPGLSHMTFSHAIFYKLKTVQIVT